MTPLSPGQFTETFTTRIVSLGHALREDSTGRSWRFALAGAANLGRGKLAVSSTVAANHINLSFATAPAAGDKKASVTLGATAAAKNLYQDGWLVNQDGTGEGRAYPIEGHDAIASAGTGTFYLKEAIDTAGATGETNVDLIRNFYAGIVISVTDQDDLTAGVPNVAITAAEYGWVQTYGPCSVWFDEAVTNGSAIVHGTGTAGQVEAFDFDSGEMQIGAVAGTAGVDTEYQLVDLTIKY